mgnify:CR=1 FL=1
MANFNSDAYARGTVLRPVSSAPFTVVATVKVPAGRAIATSDFINFVRFGANVEPLEMSFKVRSVTPAGAEAATGLFDGALGAVNVGTDASAANFISASTAWQSAAQTPVRVDQTGTGSVFASAYVPSTTATRRIVMAFANAGTQTTADDNDRYITMTATFAATRVNTPTNQPPYHYADRYDTTGSSGGLVS